jgi:hypothetical protein
MGNLGRMKILGCLLAIAGTLALCGLGQVQPVEAEWNQGNIMASVANEYAAAAEARVRASLPDSMAAWWARTKVDSTKSDASTLSIGDIAALATRLDEKQTKAAFDDSVEAALKRHALPVTAKIADKDSGYAVADSMWAQPLAEASGWPYYGNFMRFLGESAAKTDSARYGGSVMLTVAPDSLTCSMRTSDHTKTAVDIVIVDEAGTEEYAGTHTCAGDDAWEYVAVPLPDIERGRKWIRLDVRVEAGEWIDVSELVFK